MLDAHPYRAGWVAEGTVRDLIEVYSAAWEELDAVLISSIDSHREVGQMPWVREHLAQDPRWALSVSPLTTSGRKVVEAVRSGRVFFGFDEVWVPSRLPVAVPPAEAYLVAPRKLSQGVPEAVIRWMNVSECWLGIGDGAGLNSVARDFDLADKLGLLAP